MYEATNASKSEVGINSTIIYPESDGWIDTIWTPVIIIL